MMRSLFSGVAGLKAHQTKMDVIGNNIANVNTYGYKSQRVSFKDSFYQTLANSSDATDVLGGGNPSQVGYGSIINSIDVLHTRGGFASTGNTMDVFINGEGYLVARDARGNESYTRVGILNFDGDGNLVDGNKNYICGYPLARYKGSVDAKAAAVDLGNVSIDFNAENGSFFNNFKIKSVTDGTMTADSASAEIDLTNKVITVKGNGNIDAATLQDALRTATVTNGSLPATIDLNRIVTDGTGSFALDTNYTQVVAGGDTAHDIGDVMFQDVPASAANIKVNNLDISFGNTNGEYFNGYRIKTVQESSATGTTASIDIGNKLITVTSKEADVTNADLEAALKAMTVKEGSGTLPSKIDLNLITVSSEGATILAAGVTTTKAINGADAIKKTIIDKSNGIQQIKKPGALIDSDNDGTYDTELSGVIKLSGISIGPDGIITGEDENGTILQIGQIVLADIPNPEALTLEGNSYLKSVSNTGEITYNIPGDGSVGQLVSGGLENSNVDLANEFADMILTQRGFQANSRIITVGDEMLQELVNLKR